MSWVHTGSPLEEENIAPSGCREKREMNIAKIARRKLSLLSFILTTATQEEGRTKKQIKEIVV